MNTTERVGEKSVIDCITFLTSLKNTIEVIDVQSDKNFREKDVDIVLFQNKNGIKKEVWIEVKGDRYYHTGNYFFETISNKSKQTLGCFLYTEGKYLFYYFIDKKELHILEIEPIKKWFIENINKFKEKETSTPVGNGKFYITVGRLVPRKLVLDKFPKKVKVVDLTDLLKHH